MAGIFGSSGKTVNPVGGLGIMIGLVGAALSAALWLVHFQPETTVLGHYGAQLATGGALADQVGLLASFLGVMAVLFGIIGGMGGRGSGSTVASLVFGIAALSYPVLTSLDVVQRYVPNPLR
jgi:hypothetical protein